MNLDEELHEAGRALVDSSAATTTPAELARTVRRRRATRLAGVVTAVVLLVGAGALVLPEDEESRVEITDTPAPSDTDERAPSTYRISDGLGPSKAVDADGNILEDLPSSFPEPERGDDIGFAVLQELAGSTPGAEELHATLRRHGLEGDLLEMIPQLGDAGLTIVTTVDPDAQEAAEDAIAAEGPTNGPSTALLSADPRTGATRALVGPTAWIARQGASVVKPAVMVAAIESGVGTDERLDNPAVVAVDIDESPQPWEVHNFGGSSSEPVTMAEALALGSNTVWVGLLGSGRLEPAAVADAGERLGYSLSDVYPAIMVGAFDVTPMQVATMTAAIANGGMRPAVHLIDRVLTPDGDVLFERSSDSTDPVEAAVDPETTRSVRDAMEQVICCGTGADGQIDADIAQIGQTGTGQDFRDAWFAGSTPAATTVVWVGHLDGPVSMTNPTITGGSHPARVWKHYTTSISEPDDPREFPR